MKLPVPLPNQPRKLAEKKLIYFLHTGNAYPTMNVTHSSDWKHRFEIELPRIIRRIPSLLTAGPPWCNSLYFRFATYPNLFNCWTVFLNYPAKYRSKSFGCHAQHARRREGVGLTSSFEMIANPSGYLPRIYTITIRHKGYFNFNT